MKWKEMSEEDRFGACATCKHDMHYHGTEGCFKCDCKEHIDACVECGKAITYVEHLKSAICDDCKH